MPTMTATPNMALRERRRQLSLSQAETALILGVSRATYQNWELGVCEPQPAHRVLVDAFVSGGVAAVKKARRLPKGEGRADA